MSGAEPALIYGGLTAAEAASVAAAMTAAEAAAAGTAVGAGASAAGAAGTAAGAAGAGEAVSGAYGLTAAELAAMEGTAAANGMAAADAFALGDSVYQGSGLLGTDPATAMAQADAVYGGADQLTQSQHYLNLSKDGFRSLGKAYNKLPQGVSSMATQGLLGGGQGQQNNVSAPRPQGPPANPQPTAGLLGASNQPLPKVTPYAPSVGGGNDAEEMKRRLMMMLQGYA